jgi:diguanylate cyclase (GGDEF)-like protein
MGNGVRISLAVTAAPSHLRAGSTWSTPSGTLKAMNESPPQLENQDPATRDVRTAAARVLLDRMDVIIADSVAVFPFSGPQPLDAEYCERLGQLLLQLLAAAVRDGQLEARAGFVSDLQHLAAERSLPAERLFAFVYLVERTALDELALSEALGATSEPWPLIAQLVRRGSFDVVAAYTDRCQQNPSGTVLIDRLTTLYSRAVMDVVLANEVQRSDRFNFPMALIVFDIDRLSDINSGYGYGVGDRVLERLGILIHKYFRQNDWVFRHADDSIGVLLCQATPDDAVLLAEHVLGMVKERLGFKDYRTERRVHVTVSAAVVTAQGTSGEPLGAERLLFEAEAALERAKRVGPNQVERAIVVPSSLSVGVAAHYLECSPTAVRKLIANGTLRTSGPADDPAIEWVSLEDYRRATSLRPPRPASL